MLKRLSLKRCDLGRIPRSLGKLSSSGRTAISPFTAYTIIRQLHSSKHLPNSSQHSTKGSKFSIPSDEVGMKEFVIPLSHEEFVNSFRTELPREDVAVRHRVLFVGNEKNWNSMESTLNRQNRGQSFDILQCYDFLKLLKKTGALSRDYTVKRKKSLGLLQRKIVAEMTETTRSTDSSVGVVLESSSRVKLMNDACSDDVAGARVRTGSTGAKTLDPGVNSSLFWNKSSQCGNLPLLRSMLNDIPGKRRCFQDSLLLRIKRELPNEFENFTEITTHTFPDLFPIPLKDKTINLTNINIRRHLLDFYDNRFGDKSFIFWLFGILTRHKSVYQTCTFFKRNTKARENYQKLCNDPELEEKLERAIENEDSREAKKLNKKFTSLLRTVGGKTPWSTLERQATLGRVKALCGFFGPPSIFLTIAPCIADSQICIRLCNNVHCSYTMKESTHAERSRWTSADPVASAKAFRLIINAVVHTFVGIPTGNLRRSNFTDVSGSVNPCAGSSDTVLAEAFERHLQSRRGIMGVAQAFDGIFEPQGRGALHMHSIIFMLVSAEMIARCSKGQLKFLCKAIDRVIATWIHENDVKAEELEKELPELSTRCALREIPKNMNLLKLGSFSKRIMYRCQYHGKCSHTCFKKKGYTERCRLALPKEEFQKTIVHELRMNRAKTGEILIPIRDAEIGPPPVIGNLSFPGPDSRVLWIDHRRRNAVDCNMVDGNLSLSASLGWNTSVNFISATGSAQSAIYYISKYMSKNPTGAKSILPLVYSAVSKRRLYPSIAQDSGSSKRNATHLTQIVLNLLNGGDECSDQMAASAVYNLPSFISSHSFVNLYTVDFINYVKSGGKSLQDDVNILDEEEFDSEDDIKSNPTGNDAYGETADSGYGQGARPIREKLSEDVGGAVRITIARDIDDYIHRGVDLIHLSPYVYKSLITRVSKKQMEKRSTATIHAGAQKSLTFNFDPEHPLAHTHVQRLNMKPRIVKLIGKGLPKDPGPWYGPRHGNEFLKWYRKKRKLTNYLQAVFLPFEKTVHGMRAPEDIEVELRNLKKTYIGQHLLRTIHNSLTIPNISYDWKKGIQLLRHAKSRKRSCLFWEDKVKEKQPFAREEEDVAEVLCAAQMKELMGGKSNSRMDGHLKDVRIQQKKLFDMMKGGPSKVGSIPRNTFTVSTSEKRLAEIEQNVEKLERKFFKSLRRSNSNLANSMEVDEEKLYSGLTSDQRAAADYFLSTIRGLGDSDQLLMLLHGQPGSGKSFFIERVRDNTNLQMKITASSGLAGMSLGGTTLDWLMGFGYRCNSTVDLDTLRTRLKGTELLIIDEISMIGCRKLLKVDALLKRVFKDNRAFGGLNVLVVGDFAQLPAVRQIPIIDTMVNSTKSHCDHSDLEIQVEALFGLFKKFELRGFVRSKDCKKLRKLLKKFRDYNNPEPTLSEDDIKRIGILNKRVLKKDPKFKVAPILVTTRKERDAINKRSGCEWARKNGVPVYWWYQRATRKTEDTLEADHYAHSMSKFCCGVRAFYIPGVRCMLKANPFPAVGYANGSQGRMIGIVHDDSHYTLPSGSPGEMIMIPPPRFIIMEVHHKGRKKKTSIFPCERKEIKLEYKRDGKDCVYRCWSNMVVLNFAMTIHETQGQTLERIILLLGRLPGMHVGRITWQLIYVALSRTRRFSHIKFFPTGSCKYYHSMYFAHLLKLSMPANFKKWCRSYIDHSWDRNVLRKEHLQKVKEVEKRLKRLGEKQTKHLKWVDLHSFLKQMGYKVTTRDRKMKLFCKLKEHMMKKSLWKNSTNRGSVGRRGHQDRKRENPNVEVKSSQKCRSLLRGSKRLKKKKQSNDDYEVQRRRSGQSACSPVSVQGKKRKCVDSGRDLVLRKVKRKKISKSTVVKDICNMAPQNHQTSVCKGLRNQGNTCYFNSVIQCLFHCPTFTVAVENLPPVALTVDVVNHIQILLRNISSIDFPPYITPKGCLTAALNIPECKSAGIVKGAQQDASEFLGHLLEHFYQKFRPLSDMFEGILVTVHTCQLCSHSYTKTQPFKQYTLQMDLPSTHATQTFDLYNLMNYFHQAGIIEGCTCSNCHSQNSTEKITTISALPRILVIHLSRFRGLQKINNFVRFPEQASIKYKIDDNEYNKQYRLMGVVVHIGSSIAQGHYVCYVRVGENWMKADDGTVTAVRFKSVRRKKAYLLFYEQM